MERYRKGGKKEGRMEEETWNRKEDNVREKKKWNSNKGKDEMEK